MRQAATIVLAPVRDDPVCGIHLVQVAAALLLAVITRAEIDDVDAGRVADLPGPVSTPPVPGEPVWPCEPLTEGEIRVRHYLPTHLSQPEIAAELYLSTNTVKTHLRHLYRKLDAHSRHEVVERARLVGLIARSARRARP